MTAAHDRRHEWLTGSWDGIFQHAVDHFDCRMYATGQTSKGKEGRKRAKKQETIHKTIDRFRQVLAAGNPPRTKQEAVEMVSPFLTLLLSILFKQFAVQVIEWLWDQLESQDSDR